MIMKRDGDHFFTVKWWRRFHAAAQFILLITLLAGLHWLVMRHYVRWDQTADKRYSLTPESQAYLRQLRQPVQVIITIPKNSPHTTVQRAYKDVSRLLKSYQYAVRDLDVPFQVEHVDVINQRKRAEELAAQFDIQHENSLLIVYGEKFKKILASDLYDSKLTVFKGEEVLTLALLELSNVEQPCVYFLTGHGEMSPDSTDPVRGLSQFKTFLAQRNFELRSWDLARDGALPEGRSVVVSAGSQVAYLSGEVALLRQYMAKNGRILVFLRPLRFHGLDLLLSDWGLLCDDRVIVDASKDRVASGDLIVRRFVSHKTTKVLLDAELTLLFGLSRPVRVDIGAGVDNQLTTTQILYSSENSWAKPSGFSDPSFDIAADIRGPVSLGAVAERTAVSPAGVRAVCGKLAVFGNADFVANNRFNVLGNSLFLNTLTQWLVDSDAVVHIPSRAAQGYQLILTRAAIFAFCFKLLLIPCVVATIGVCVWIRRRR